MATAIITGASGGLGFHIAEEMARRRYDLLLIARGEDGLRAAAEKLRVHGTRLDICAADLTSREGLARAVSAIGGCAAPEVLVNNAGFGNYGRFWELALEDGEGEIDLNIAALVHLTRAVLPRMVGAGKGTVINVASTAGFQPVPYMSVYGATKAFVISFSEGVMAELGGSGVRGVNVVALCPGPMETGFQSRAGASKSTYGMLPWETAEDVARKAGAIIGRGKGVHITHWLNMLMVFTYRFSPRWMVAAIGERIFRPAKQGKTGVGV
jgi:uncharacterized protein